MQINDLTNEQIISSTNIESSYDEDKEYNKSRRNVLVVLGILILIIFIILISDLCTRTNDELESSDSIPINEKYTNTDDITPYVEQVKNNTRLFVSEQRMKIDGITKVGVKVENYCDTDDIEVEWSDGDILSCKWSTEINGSILYLLIEPNKIGTCEVTVILNKQEKSIIDVEVCKNSKENSRLEISESEMTISGNVEVGVTIKNLSNSDNIVAEWLDDDILECIWSEKQKGNIMYIIIKPKTVGNTQVIITLNNNEKCLININSTYKGM